VSLPELPVSPGGTDAPASPSPGSSSVRSRIVFMLGCAVAGAVVGVLAGWLWSAVVDAPVGVVFDGEVFYDEIQRNVQAGLTLWFIVIGVLVGVLAGLVVGLVGRRHGVVTVAAVLVLCVVASGVMAVFGIGVFGPDEAAQVASAEQGDEITGGLEVATWVAYLGFPIGGLVGVLAAIAGWPRDAEGPAGAAPSDEGDGALGSGPA
jgi:hypothetical protein